MSPAKSYYLSAFERANYNNICWKRDLVLRRCPMRDLRSPCRNWTSVKCVLMLAKLITMCLFHLGTLDSLECIRVARLVYCLEFLLIIVVCKLQVSLSLPHKLSIKVQLKLFGLKVQKCCNSIWNYL